MVAAKAGRMADAERALLIQQRLGQASGSRHTESEAIRALAVVRRQCKDEAGVEAALEQLAALTPGAERVEALREVRALLERVAPARVDQTTSLDANAHKAEVSGRTTALASHMCTGAVVGLVMALVVAAAIGGGDR